MTSSENVTLVVCGILLGYTIENMISLSSLISANNDAVFIFVVFGLAPPCGVDYFLVSSYIGKRLQLLNDSQSTVQFKLSTPKPVDSETERSDSGIIATRGFGVDCLSCTFSN
jgi:hypothetical protein